MRKVILVLAIFVLILWPGVKIQALPASPVQLSPSDSATTTSTKLQWLSPAYSLYSPNPYRIQVDDENTFSVPITKDYDTANTYYTPQLNPGSYFWRVKAKDSSGTWSDWSSTWKFIYSLSSPTPTSSPVSTPSPTPSPATTSAPQSPATISMSQVPSNIDINQQFTLQVSLANFSPTTNLYLKGAFKKTDSTNYFGQTLVNNSWVKNYQTYSSQLPITTDTAGKWTGDITLKGDPNDSGFAGEGDYIFKVGYYQDSAISWSSESTIHLSGNKDSTAQTQPSATPPTFSSSPAIKAQTQSNFKPKLSLPATLLGTSAASASGTYISSSVSATEKTAGFKQNKLLLIIAGITLIISGSIILLYAKFHYRFPRPN